MNQLMDPLHVFRFHVDFKDARLQGDPQDNNLPLCSGAFSECTGLEATMEPKVIKAGGLNYGAFQRVGSVTFATVILKRGVVPNQDLWKWFEMTTSKGHYAYRLTVTITMQNMSRKPVLKWQVVRALPTKFKAADFNAKGTEVGVEELHLVHEGLSLVSV